MLTRVPMSYMSSVDDRVPVGGDDQLLVAGERLLDGVDRPRPGDAERHHVAREDHIVLEREQRQPAGLGQRGLWSIEPDGVVSHTTTCLR
jgi:hypothetical protein